LTSWLATNKNLQITLFGYYGRCTDQGCAITGSSAEGGAVVGNSAVDEEVVNKLSSLREASQLDNDVLPPSNCRIRIL
jgi:hypothetical protein